MDRFHMSDLLKAVRMPLDMYGHPADKDLYSCCMTIYFRVLYNESLLTYLQNCRRYGSDTHKADWFLFSSGLPSDKYTLLVGACSELGLSEIAMELLHLRPAPATSPSLRL